MAKFAVMGSPIEHSLSPTLHRSAFEYLGLEAEYEAKDVSSLTTDKSKGFAGLSLTMPLKVEAYNLADTHDEESLATGVSNTLLFTGGTIAALNTDVYGISQAVSRLEADSVQIIGTGATAKSAAYALREKRLFFSGRTKEKVRSISEWAMVQGMNLEAMRSVDLVIDTTPGESVLEYVEHSYILDVAYASDRNVGAKNLISGLEMLLHQAVLQNISFSAQLTSMAIDPLRLTEAMRRALAKRVGEWANA